MGYQSPWCSHYQFLRKCEIKLTSSYAPIRSDYLFWAPLPFLLSSTDLAKFRCATWNGEEWNQEGLALIGFQLVNGQLTAACASTHLSVNASPLLGLLIAVVLSYHHHLHHPLCVVVATG